MHNDLPVSFYVGQPDNTSKVIQDFWDIFKTTRFFVDKKTTLLSQHIETIARDTYTLGTDNILYRARILDEGVNEYKDSELYAPEEKYVGIGRLNARRIRYLYAAERDRTAAAEMRPWIGATITIATVKPKQDLSVVNFVPTKDEKNRLNSFKRQISEKFSEPVRPSISDVEYLPTQCIAEYIKAMGFHGIRYQSAVDPYGVNYCFFDPDTFDIKVSHNLKLNSVQYDFQ